jgi:hypothetical protein
VSVSVSVCRCVFAARARSVPLGAADKCIYTYPDLPSICPGVWGF